MGRGIRRMSMERFAQLLALLALPVAAARGTAVARNIRFGNKHSFLTILPYSPALSLCSCFVDGACNGGNVLEYVIEGMDDEMKCSEACDDFTSPTNM